MRNSYKYVLGALAVLCSFPAFSRGVFPDQVSKKDTFPLHDNVRTQPYPRAEHELYLNPPPLLVPKEMQTADSVQFSLSQRPDFSGKSTVVSKTVAWSMFSPHKTLKPGTWYWRFRSVGKNGKGMGWSQPYSFTVKNETPKFTTPPFERLVSGIPVGYPRLYSFLQEGIIRNRQLAPTSPEYKILIGRADGELKKDFSAITDIAARIGALGGNFSSLHQAYVVTDETKYADKLLENCRLMLSLTSDKALENDFIGGDFCLQLLNIYDCCSDRLSREERKAIEDFVVQWAAKYYRNHALDIEENHVYDNHFWQHTIRVLFQTGVMFHDHNKLAREMLEYSYELWVTRAPNGGFINDGSWYYGTGYFNTDAPTTFYMPAALSFFTGVDFLKHPWYQNAAQALAYIWPPDSYSPGFGDGHEGKQPSRVRVAIADYLARETGSPYAAWYVNECERTNTGSEKLSYDGVMRLYRFANLDKPYKNPGLPENHPKLMCFKDCGEVEAHSDIANTKNSLFLSFRSSPYGSGSHTLADQNSFNLHYKGLPVYRSTGHYWNFCDPHNLLSYRHTRAHNTLLIDGIGQPFTTRAYGDVLRTFDGKNISYCLGDASNAYCGVSEYPMWIENFKNANITQTAENGFGKTPLKVYRRHVLLLHPDKVVIYDELEAEKPVRWDWLLHSPVQFQIDAKDNKLTTINEQGGFQSVAQLFSKQASVITQTDKYVAEPDQKYNRHKTPIAPAYHLTVSFGPSQKNRILTVIQVTPNGVVPALIEKMADGNYQCGDWHIEAELDGEKPASMNIQNKAKNVVFSYGTDKPVINGNPYHKKQEGSSVLYDEIGGKKKVVEASDCPAQGTR